MKKKLEHEPDTTDTKTSYAPEDGEETNIYGSKLKDIWKIQELQDTVETLYRVIGKLYVENEKLKAVKKLLEKD